ncbi:MAG TPA: hypothetical protein VFC37_01990 [Terracidiphilus sp.]|nr:hypothetical protein [Terracidiphilus sp.]
MEHNLFSSLQRRDFLKLAGATAVAGITRTSFAAPGGRVAVVIDAGNSIAAGAPVKHATGKLEQALAAKGIRCEIVGSKEQARGASFTILVAGPESELARGFAHAAAPATESVSLVPGLVAGAPAVLVSAADSLGFVYGLLELAERAQFGANPLADLHPALPIHEKPANDVRCVSRYFSSEIEDKPWYYDKEFWRGYLDGLVAARFNRFCFAYGLEYDFPRGVTNDYLHLPYPYLVKVPGYENVRVVQLADQEGNRLPAPVPLSDEEREKNFAALKFIAAETGARGLHFQLGIWTHAYQWTDSPKAYHNIEGLTAETHAAYCRDALGILLKECPEIQGVTMRVHGESGIPEGSWDFWKTLFEAFPKAGRTIEIDMHAKGVNQTMIDIGVATGMPIKLGAKYSAEHQSLGYNQTDIRALEIPKATRSAEQTPFSLSSGARSFTRYGYGDFFYQGSKAKILYRLWPGTQRHLLSADPEMAAAYSRTSHFCGAAGIDLMEPLTFKGREGSGHAGGRCAYGDVSLNPKYDYQKFKYYYRVWGRKLYNPDTPLEATRRGLLSTFGIGAEPIETALANSSRILPLITSAHLVSASHHDWWTEISTNMPIAQTATGRLFWDSPEPRCFETVSPLDPQLFSTVAEHVQDLLNSNVSPKYSPVEVAQWIDNLIDGSTQALSAARTKARGTSSPEFRRIEEDILIMNSLGGYYAGQLRSATYYEIFKQTGNAKAGELALDQYKKARDIWAKMAEHASKVYMADISYGSPQIRRGSWMDRLPAIDADLDAMQKSLANPPTTTAAANAERAIKAATTPPQRVTDSAHHTPLPVFHPGKPLAVSLQASHSSTPVASARLHYRHVNQGERWLSVDMQSGSDGYTASIPGDYTDSPYPLEYYFELRGGSEAAWFHPAFNSTFSNQPYYALDKRES